MWTARAYTEKNRRVDLPIISRTGAAVSSSLVYEAVKQMSGSLEMDLPLHLLEKERRMSPLPGRDAISLWCEKTHCSLDFPSGDLKDVLHPIEDRSIAWFDSKYDQLRSLVWHDQNFVVVPIKSHYRRVILHYQPVGDDSSWREKFESAHGRSIAFLEWRGYFGNNTTIIDGLQKFDRRRTVLHLRNASGAIVGMVLNRIAKRQMTLERDPTFKFRLEQSRDRYPNFDKLIPNLADEQFVQEESCVIIVHGALSCGLSIVHSLDVPVESFAFYRYEHDTFMSVPENARELYELITEGVRWKRLKRLLFIGHSRGGLVARIVAQLLQEHEHFTDREVQVWTYGTPHQGTPIVHAAKEVLNLLYKAGAVIVDGIRVLDFISAAFSYLLKPPQLPKGILDMRPSSSMLALLNLLPQPYGLHTYAGKFDMELTESDNFGIAFKKGFGKEFFDGEENDLVVPTESAKGSGRSSYEVTDCSHFDYFGIDWIRKRIWRFAK